ncbi:hypothetical protein HYC85_008319 [Camellia sinensis]|uniref:Uncharacterized protein n=1 Tax=Camellia sinensis TaxID=4442 RepID=A0A7J7HRH4_CAMSI|nr:hypothetical protein HYC85_008319 [Camellia sinensis]
MAASPVNFLFGFLLASIILWLVFMFASRLSAWILSRIMGASVGFRVGGWKCLRDVVVKFKKGAVESVSVGEIRVSLRQSLVKLGVGFISKDPKLQVLICDLEVVMRTSGKSAQKSRSRRSRSSGRGKWMVVANMARFLSVSINELVVKMPRATIEVKELRVDISKDGGSKPALFVKLYLLPIVVHLGDPRVSYDQSSNFNHGGYTSTNHVSSALMEKTFAPLYCEELTLSSEFGHDREAGVVIKNVDITSGEVTLNLNEELFLKTKGSSDAFSHAAEVVESSVESSLAKKPQKKQATLLSVTKYASIIPEKLYFNLPKLDVNFLHRGHDLLVENNIMGIQVKSIKSRSIEDVGESTRLDIQMDFSEIHLYREASISVVEILKLDVGSSAYIPLQPTSPIRSEIEVKLGGTQCNIIMSRLKPWMHLQSSKKKKMVLQDGNSNPERQRSTESKAIMWTCTVSAPEMTIVLYSLSGSPLYHGCSQSSHVFANNISSTDTSVHMKLGELNLHMADEYQECLKESLFGVETNTNSLMHVAKVSMDWGKKDTESLEEDVPRNKVVLSVDVTGMGIYLTLKRVESLISMIMSFKSLLKNLSASSKKPQPNRGGHSSKPSAKGIQILKFNLERCSVNFSSDVGLENTVVADPKRVNYGSQGGRFIISVSADGTPRSANIMSTISDECKKLKYSVSLDIFHFSLSMNKEKQSTAYGARKSTIYL